MTNSSKLSRTHSADLVRELKDSLALKGFTINLGEEDSRDNKVARTHSEISLKNSRSFLAETKDREEVVVDNSLHTGVKT